MKKIILVLMTLILSISLLGCKFEEDKEFDTINPTRVAFLGLDILDILDTVGFEKTGITEVGMLFKSSNVKSLASFNNNKDVIDLGSHNAINYDKLDILNPELIILSSRTTSKKLELTLKYPQALIYDATQKLSDGDLMQSINNNINFLKGVFPNIEEGLMTYYNNLVLDIAAIKVKSNDIRALVIMLTGDELKYYGANSRFGMIYKDFGFSLSAPSISTDDSHGSALSYEMISEYNPEVIFVMDRTKAIGEDTAVDFNKLRAQTLVKNTIAGKNDAIYNLDGDAWYLTSGGFKATLQMILDINQHFNN